MSNRLVYLEYSSQGGCTVKQKCPKEVVIQELLFKMLLYSYKKICYQQNTLTQSNRYFAYVGKNTFSVWSKSCDLTDIFQYKSVLSFSYWHSFVLELNWISCLQPRLLFCSFRPFSPGSNFLSADIFSQLSALSPSLWLTFFSLYFSCFFSIREVP